jgi:hypothetical protein
MNSASRGGPEGHYLAMDLPHSDDCFMVPVPRVQGRDELNMHLEAQCRRRRERRLRGHTETIGERFTRDRAALLTA